MDLYPFLDDDPALSRNTIISSLLREDEIDGKLYRIIPGFTIQTLVGQASVLGDEPGWNMDEFMSVLEENPQADLPLGIILSKLDFLKVSLMHTMNDYVDREKGTVHFDKDSFIQLLEFANSFPAESINSQEPILSGHQIMISAEYGHIFFFMSNRTLLGPGTIFKGFPVENKGGHLLIPHESIAITVGCRDAEGAWMFIRSMLLDEFQRNLDLLRSFNEATFPVNRLVFDEKIDDEMNSRVYSYIGKIVGSDEWLRIPVPLLSREEADMIEVLLDSLTIITDDEILWNIVSESASDFFRGQMSAQDAARIIQSRASIYIAEQS